MLKKLAWWYTAGFLGIFLLASLALWIGICKPGVVRTSAAIQ